MIGREAVLNPNVFTQNFFTENATHIQNCTSFYPDALSHTLYAMASHF